MSKVVIRDREFRKVNESRNLRGILEYSRVHKVERVDLYDNGDGSGQLGIAWADGATCITDFACYAVCEQWVRSRKNFGNARTVRHQRGSSELRT